MNLAARLVRSAPVLLLAWAAACNDKGETRDDAAVDGDAWEMDSLDGGEGEGLVCPVGWTNCGDSCAYLPTDHDNCGVCGRACEPSQVCGDGDCMIECPSGLQDCAGSCVDLNVDARHCGSCDHACDAGQECIEGECVASCPEGSERCSGTCVDLGSDPTSCGACGRVCPVTAESPEPACEGGVCMLAFLDDGFDCTGADPLDGWVPWNEPEDGTGYRLSCDPLTGIAQISGDGAIDSLNSGMTKTVDISAWSGGPGLVLSFEWRARSTRADSTVTNARLRVYHAATGEQLLAEALQSGGTTDTGWQAFSVDLSEEAAGASAIRIVFYLRDAWSLQDYHQVAAWRSVLLRGPAP